MGFRSPLRRARWIVTVVVQVLLESLVELKINNNNIKHFPVLSCPIKYLDVRSVPFRSRWLVGVTVRGYTVQGGSCGGDVYALPLPLVVR